MAEKIHFIQKEILTKLMHNPEGLRYSYIMLKNVENDLFNYHLQQLVKRGFIRKESNGYLLNEKGNLFVSNLTAEGKHQELFKVSVALVVTRNNKEMLLQKRLRSPFYGDVTGIAGKVRKGEMVLNAAKRKLFIESGLKSEFRFIGILRKIKRNRLKEILEDTFYYYCYAESPTGKLIESNEYGENFWGSFEEALEFNKSNVDSGEMDEKVLKSILNGDYDYFFLEQDLIVKDY